MESVAGPRARSHGRKRPRTVTIYTPLYELGVPVNFQASALAAFIMIVTGFVLRRRIAAASEEGIVPDDGVTLRLNPPDKPGSKKS